MRRKKPMSIFEAPLKLITGDQRALQKCLHIERKNVNALAVSQRGESHFHNHVPVASQSRRLHVLNQHLNEVLSTSTAAVPLSTWWSTTQPNSLVAGFTNGMVYAFDLRNNIGPIATKTVTANGDVAVRSLAEVNVDGNPDYPVLLAGTSRKIEALTARGFSATMNSKPVHRTGIEADVLCCVVLFVVS